MPTTSQPELLLALERGHFDLVLDTPESDTLEFKEAPYQLQQPHQKWQLAKDVAAFANSQGGLIIIGYRSNRPATALVDLVVEHRPVAKALVNWDAYRQTLASWIYPSVEGLTPLWFPADAGIDSGVFVLVVPPQPDGTKYFVVRELDRPDGTFPGAFGVPIRQGDVVSWVRPETIHHLLREALGVRRSGPALVTAVDRAVVLQGEQARVEERCRQLQTRAEWTDVPFIALHALPHQPIARPDNFYSDRGPRAALEHPSVLRRTGFHIRTESEVEVQADGSLVAATGRRVLWLSPDGFFSAAARADADFFGWYVNEGPSRPLAINSRVLTEYSLEFARFVHNHVKPMSADTWALWLSVVGLDRDGGSCLFPRSALVAISCVTGGTCRRGRTVLPYSRRPTTGSTRQGPLDAMHIGCSSSCTRLSGSRPMRFRSLKMRLSRRDCCWRVWPDDCGPPNPRMERTRP